jgi:hypothetical protein
MNITDFQTPPKEYREAPFWSWNDDLDPQELARQIRLMDEAGWGGFFMHSRVGLRTPYMGKSWMACIRACVEAARQCGLGAWLYDEDKWPSGFAGGLSVAGDPAYRAYALACKVDNRPALVAERIATFAAREVEGQLTDIRPCDAPPFDDDADRLIQFYPKTMQLGTTWFNDYSYVNLFNPDAVRAFLDSTHEVYAAAIGADFGGVVPGIFTDEPSIFRPETGGSLPWADDFPAIFQARNGYDLLPHLPALLFDVGDYQAVRYDYWRTVTQRFVEAFTRPVYEWCQAHSLAFTGHFNCEDTLLAQVQWNGAVMPHYPYMHVPGIDKLGRQINAGPGTVLTVKQLDSVVCQTGKPRALCENYGCSGQDFAHTGRKWIGDWAYVLGVTFNNLHLALYSMRGARKRDYPQVVFYQQPWWPENRLVADYFARLSYSLSQGQRVADILVIHPIASAWTLFRPDAARAVDQLDRSLDDLLMTLMRSQRDFHLGDEMLMEPGSPCEAKVSQDEAGPRLDVGRMAYRLVIVPLSTTLSANTVRLLDEFAAAGGPVLALEPTPTLIDGRPARRSVLPATTRLVATPAGVPEVLDGLLPFDVRVAGRPAIWAHHRRSGASDWYFLANTDLDGGGPATVHIRGTGRLEAWDPATGDITQLPCRQQDGVTEVTLDFPPVGSHLLVLHRDQAPAAALPAPERVVSHIPLAAQWQLTLDGPNALTLDTPQHRIGNGAWQEPAHILNVHTAIARAGVGSPFALRFTFDALACPAVPVYLVVESPGRFAITVNGQAVGGDEGWWTDISFRKVNVSAAVRAGRNEVVLSGVFARDTELESVYLVGDFGVAGRRLKEENRFNGQVFDRYAPQFMVTEVPDRVQARGKASQLVVDLTAQGLAFYAGRARLRQAITLPALGGRTLLEIDNLHAAVAHVRVNGQPQGSVAWPPHRVDVTHGLKPGENVIEIELVGTLRNLLGPHHRAGGDLVWTGAPDFRDKSRWTEDYILVPFGLNGVTLKTLEA